MFIKFETKKENTTWYKIERWWTFFAGYFSSMEESRIQNDRFCTLNSRRGRGIRFESVANIVAENVPDMLVMLLVEHDLIVSVCLLGVT